MSNFNVLKVLTLFQGFAVGGRNNPCNNYGVRWWLQFRSLTFPLTGASGRSTSLLGGITWCCSLFTSNCCCCCCCCCCWSRMLPKPSAKHNQECTQTLDVKSTRNKEHSKVLWEKKQGNEGRKGKKSILVEAIVRDWKRKAESQWAVQQWSSWSKL